MEPPLNGQFQGGYDTVRKNPRIPCFYPVKIRRFKKNFGPKTSKMSIFFDPSKKIFFQKIFNFSEIFKKIMVFFLAGVIKMLIFDVFGPIFFLKCRIFTGLSRGIGGFFRKLS